MDQSNKKIRKGLGGKAGKLVMMSLYRATAKPPSPVEAAKQRATVEFIKSQPKQSVAVVLPVDTSGRAADHYGGFPVDEAVDLKAATYISTVRERIRLQVS